MTQSARCCIKTLESRSICWCTFSNNRLWPFHSREAAKPANMCILTHLDNDSNHSRLTADVCIHSPLYFLSRTETFMRFINVLLTLARLYTVNSDECKQGAALRGQQHDSEEKINTAALVSVSLDAPSPAPPSFSPGCPALLLHLCRGGCAVACCSHPPPPQILLLQSCYTQTHTHTNNTFTSRKLISLSHGRVTRWHLYIRFSSIQSVLCSLWGCLKRWIIETLLKLQWEDTSIIKRTGGNIVCTLYLSISHALLTALSAFYSINGEQASQSLATASGSAVTTCVSLFLKPVREK